MQPVVRAARRGPPVRLGPSTRPGRQILDRQRILEAALDLVERDGLDALSMRKLGSGLSVEAMALYHYFPSKAALVDGLVGVVLGRLELPEPGPGQDWAAVVRQVARSFRDLGTAHPNIFPLLATIGLDNPASLAPAEAVLAVLTGAGLNAGEAFDAFVALKSYVVGYTLWAIGDRAARQRRADVSCFDVSCVVVDVGGADYPRLAELAGWLAERHLDAEFEAGLDLLIDGIRARLNTSAAAPEHAG
jgi:AcrR family transcriptional regulator